MKTGKDYIDNTGDGTVARVIHIAEMNEIIEQIRREQHEADIKAIEVAILNVRAIVANTDPAFLVLITAIEKTLNSITFEDTQQSGNAEGKED